jgi:hypothetical protein
MNPKKSHTKTYLFKQEFITFMVKLAISAIFSKPIGLFLQENYYSLGGINV